MKTVSPYLSAEALGLKEEHRQALIGLADDLVHHRIADDDWEITSWERCICGHLQRRTGVGSRHGFVEGGKLLGLFTGYSRSAVRARSDCAWAEMSQEQAGQATYNYLTLGKPCWDEVLGGEA